jgi:predicted Zn-dependent peptidase
MPVTFREYTLENGLTVIGELDPDAHTAAMGFFVKTGSRDEVSPLMGVSHFLEHMMFKGTERRSADDVNREFDEIGAQYNAYTSQELTCFYAATLPEHLHAAGDILCDILRPALREEDFSTEKNVILEEIAMYRDNPFWTLYEKSMERYYADHPLAHRVLGTPETIEPLERDAMKAYFDDRYSADNTVVSVAGRVQWEDLIDEVQSRCGHWARTGAARSGERPATESGELRIEDAKAHRGYALMLAPAPAMQDERRYAAMMLAKVLGDHDNSRLHWALIETGLAEEAVAEYDPRDGCGDYLVFVSGDPDKIDGLWGAAEKEIDGLVDSLDESDLEKLRNRLATAVTLAGERPSGRMQRLGRLWTYLGEYTPLEEELARINAVTLDEVRAVWEAYPMRPRLVSKLVPKKG